MSASAAERMRRMRARRKAVPTTEPILYERADWRLFVDPGTLPQKAGCKPGEIGCVILKELTDNSLDAGAGQVAIKGDDHHAVISDDGPGLDAADVVRLFAVNRPLLSSKLKRLPTRGMLGNGLRVVMGAIAAYRGKIVVVSRGRRQELTVNPISGNTDVLAIDEVDSPGMTVEISFPSRRFTESDFARARMTARLAAVGDSYDGPSRPEWYGRGDLEKLIAAAPNGATRAEVLRDIFGTDDIPKATREIVSIGYLGTEAFDGEHAMKEGEVSINGAHIPYCVEAWVETQHAARDDYTSDWTPIILNRTVSLAELSLDTDSAGTRVHGCGLDFNIASAKRAKIDTYFSIITPFVRLMNDGKTPYLGDFREPIEKVIGKAARTAYAKMLRPPVSMSITDAANAVMRQAYLKASDNGTLPAKARQIMYAARGDILRLTGRLKFSDTYFTQVLLPNYLRDNPEETANWDVVYDARGHLVEPHTNRTVALGTVQVRAYLGHRPPLHPAGQIEVATMFPTSGPVNRYRNVLFIEKEGFDELFEAVQLAERCDLAIMSTKGMSVVAARQLLDEVSADVDHVFVLHDFDISGFSIFGTLGTDSRRYEFENKVPIVDIGLRLGDVEAMALEAEPVEVSNRDARRETLEEHGATADEIEFLAPADDNQPCRRVELNAMTSRQLVDFVEAALRQHGVAKVIPNATVLEEHARRLIKTAVMRDTLATMAEEIDEEAAKAELPTGLAERVRAMLIERPELSWDQALAEILG